MSEDKYHAATGPVLWLPTWSFVDTKPVELGESYIPLKLAPILKRQILLQGTINYKIE